jgi:hypothetical protein
MPVILVFVIAVAWMVILGPSLLKRRSRTAEGIGSISRFHRALRTLEHSAPEPIVPPAYRLHSANPGGATGQGAAYPQVSEVPVLTVVGADRLPRPALAFLGDPAGPPHATRGTTAGDPSGTGSALEYRADHGLALSGSPQLATSPRPLGAPRPADIVAHRQTLRRRRDTLGVLLLVFVVTLMIGFVPGAAAAWVVAALSGTATAAYVAMLVQLRRAAEEREQKLRYLRPGPPAAGLPEGATRVPVYMSGRYAHPSNQAAAAH